MSKMSKEQCANIISAGQACLGIEFGSTRIKAVLIDESGYVLSSGGYDWENHYEDGIWTYSLSEVWHGLSLCYANLNDNIFDLYGVCIKELATLGISGMMHGYLPFDKNGKQLANFRTWRNNITEDAAEELTNLFDYNIPQRWSIAHLYNAVLHDESHVKDIDFLTTLSGYVHWQLTGKKVLGICEASGMFPIDINTHDFNKKMMMDFNSQVEQNNFPWKLEQILPKVLLAGQDAGHLTDRGAKLLDPTGELKPGCAMCPPEGDGGTGMVATNSLAVRTGNVSAGTSAFAMLVLEKELSKVYKSLDMVTTPSGDLVAMAHSNNCSTEINCWVGLFEEFSKILGVQISKGDLYSLLFESALSGDPDCGNIMSYCFHSGEHGLDLSSGCPLFLHPTDSNFNLANFIRCQIYTCFAAMKLGMDILLKEEGAKIDKIYAHGGLFKTPKVAQGILSAAIATPVEVYDTASEGGAWGIALLAAYRKQIINGKNINLNSYISSVFKNFTSSLVYPRKADIQGYEKFFKNFQKYLPAEKQAVKCIHRK